MPSFIVWSVPSSVVLIAGMVFVMLLQAARRSSLDRADRKRFVVGVGSFLTSWLALAFVFAYLGVFQAGSQRAFPATAVGIAVPLVSGAILLWRSRLWKAVRNVIPLPWLVGIQFYRVIGVNFLVLYGLNLMPFEFAFPAGAGDLLVGLAAPLVAWALYRGGRGAYRLALGWNLFGILDLAAAVTLGVLTSPGPLQRLALGRPNEWITAHPWVLVPLFAVPLSILLHMVAMQKAGNEARGDRHMLRPKRSLSARRLQQLG